MSYTFTPAENADPTGVAEYTARLAKLRPACTRCGHTLTKRELESGTGQCASRDDCTLRAIFAGPKPAGGKGLHISEVHAQIRYRRTRGREIAVTDSAREPEPPAAVEEWRPLNPYVWRPRKVTS